MYEDRNNSIDWKGIFLKVVIVFLVVLIGIKIYSTFKDNNKKDVNTTTETVAKSKISSTFTANIEKLKKAGESYFNSNKDKIPTVDGSTTMVTLNELVNNGVIGNLTDEDGKTCDGESSYVTAIKEGEKVKIKANLVCGSASSYSLIYMGENDSTITEETKTNTSNSGSSSSTTSTKTTTTTNSGSSSNCGTSCGTPSVTVSTNTSAKQEVKINDSKSKVVEEDAPVYTADMVTVSFDSRGGSKIYSSQRVKIGSTAVNPGSTSKYGSRFIGWYYNGYLYDFSTPVRNNITLYAVYDTDDYNNDYYYNYSGSGSSSSRSRSRSYSGLQTGTAYTYVYTMGWDTKGTTYISIDHKLRLPETLKDVENNRTVDTDNIEKIKISKVTYDGPINTYDKAQTFLERHPSTFLYTWDRDWEATSYVKSTLATIRYNHVTFDYSYSKSYKTVSEAKNEGFRVIWTADYVDQQCTNGFNVNGRVNLCNYGIVYRVEWTFQYYV